MDSHALEVASTISCPTCGLKLAPATRFCPNDSTPLSVNQLNRLIHHYKVIQLLGTGGMGDVYEAEHVVLKKRFAIKILKSHLADTTALLRFQSEAQAASRIRHQNVVTVHDCGVSQSGEPFMVMDLVKGETLADKLRRQGALSIEESLDLFRQVCDGVISAHTYSILHRDLKPSNIILGTEGSKTIARLTDFGIAKITNDENIELTKTGELFGTPSYMSPEQAAGEKLDQRSDLYALGCILYEMLTGQPPFLGKSPLDVLFKHVNEMPLPLSEAALRKFPERLESIVARLLSKSPADRFANAEELRSAILAYSQGKEEPDRPATAKKKSKGKVGVLLVTAIGISGTLALAAYSVSVLWPDTPDVNLPKTGSIIAEPALQSSDQHNQPSFNPDGSKDVGQVKTDEFLPKPRKKESLSFDPGDDIGFSRYLAERRYDEKISVPFDFIDISDASLAQMKDCHRLKELDLVDCNAITDQGLSALRDCRNLQVLNLKGCRKITVAGLKEIINLPQLSRLNLASSEIGDGIFKVIGEKPILELDLSHSKISDKELLRITPSLKVQSMQLKGDDISDQGLIKIGKSAGLASLDLDDCPRVGDQGVQYISNSNIRFLGLKRTAISDNVIKSLLKMQHLEVLSLEETNIGNPVLIELAKSKSLKRLYVKGSSRINHDDIVNFRANSKCEIKWSPQ